MSNIYDIGDTGEMQPGRQVWCIIYCGKDYDKASEIHKNCCQDYLSHIPISFKNRDERVLITDVDLAETDDFLKDEKKYMVTIKGWVVLCNNT